MAVERGPRNVDTQPQQFFAPDASSAPMLETEFSPLRVDKDRKENQRVKWLFDQLPWMSQGLKGLLEPGYTRYNGFGSYQKFRVVGEYVSIRELRPFFAKRTGTNFDEQMREIIREDNIGVVSIADGNEEPYPASRLTDFAVLVTALADGKHLKQTPSGRKSSLIQIEPAWRVRFGAGEELDYNALKTALDTAYKDRFSIPQPVQKPRYQPVQPVAVDVLGAETTNKLRQDLETLLESESLAACNDARALRCTLTWWMLRTANTHEIPLAEAHRIVGSAYANVHGNRTIKSKPDLHRVFTQLWTNKDDAFDASHARKLLYGYFDDATINEIFNSKTLKLAVLRWNLHVNNKAKHKGPPSFEDYWELTHGTYPQLRGMQTASRHLLDNLGVSKAFSWRGLGSLAS